MRLPGYLLVWSPMLVWSVAACQEADSTSSAHSEAAVQTLAAVRNVSPEPPASAPAAAATAPADTVQSPTVATQPAIEDIPSDTVLVRLGDAEVITQGDFEKAAAGAPPSSYERMLERLISDRLFLLYLKDRPHLAPDEEVEKLIDRSRKKNQTREQFIQEIEKRGFTMDIVRERNRISLGISALKREADQKIETESYRHELFYSDPSAFNGTEVYIRAITIPVLDATPEEKAARRRKIEDIRQRLVDGRIDWQQALEESENPANAASGGALGWKQRYSFDDTVCRTAFAMRPGDYSPVIEALGALAILHVRDRREGTRGPDDPQSIQAMKVYLENRTIDEAYREAAAKYPPQRIRLPARTPLMASKELFRQRGGPATQPAGQTG